MLSEASQKNLSATIVKRFTEVFLIAEVLVGKAFDSLEQN